MNILLFESNSILKLIKKSEKAGLKNSIYIPNVAEF